MAAQSEKSFPFDSDVVNGKYDREYLADDFARYFRAFISSGVFMKSATNLQVIANGDMSVTLLPGNAIIEGYRYENETDLVLELGPADGVLNRIDRIAITWSKEDRDIHCSVREGVPSYEPVAPECRRTDDYIDYVVADVYISAGAIIISQSDITDQRLNSEICGLAIAFSDVDTTTLYQQIQADLEEFQEVGQAEFEAWFANIQNQLDGDVAANLQNQINAIGTEATNADIDAIFTEV